MQLSPKSLPGCTTEIIFAAKMIFSRFNYELKNRSWNRCPAAWRKNDRHLPINLLCRGETSARNVTINFMGYQFQWLKGTRLETPIFLLGMTGYLAFFWWLEGKFVIVYLCDDIKFISTLHRWFGEAWWREDTLKWASYISPFRRRKHFQFHFFNENSLSSHNILLKYVPCGLIDNISALVKTMA